MHTDPVSKLNCCQHTLHSLTSSAASYWNRLTSDEITEKFEVGEGINQCDPNFISAFHCNFCSNLHRFYVMTINDLVIIDDDDDTVLWLCDITGLHLSLSVGALKRFNAQANSNNQTSL